MNAVLTDAATDTSSWLGSSAPRISSSTAGHLLWLHAEHDEPRAAYGVAIRGARRDAELRGEPLGSLAVRGGHGDATGIDAARVDQPAHERLAELAGAEQRDRRVEFHPRLVVGRACAHDGGFVLQS
jgi:hypothetical protein